MTLGELAITVALLCALGLAATRIGLSAIPAYLLAGLVLGPNEPHATTLIHLSEVTEFVAEIGLVFLLFFLGIEFTLDRLLRSGRHLGRGGAIDLLLNLGLGLVVGVAAFGFSVAAIVVATAIYVSSSAIAVKGLIDFRRLADEETDLVLAILVVEDLAIAVALGFVGGGGGTLGTTLEIVFKALVFITLSLAASRWLAKPINRVLQRLPREFFLLSVFAFLIGMAGLSKWLGLSEAIGALMAGVVLAETDAREEIEERFFSFRDVFAALFFFAFGLTIDLGSLGMVAWLLLGAVLVTLVGKLATGVLGGLAGGFSARQGFNAGAALVAHGEFTVIIAQLAGGNSAIPEGDQAILVAFAGLYVLATAIIGIVLMKKSKALARRMIPRPTLEPGG